MEWVMLKESKKLFPHWLDKNDDSNFSKHLNILNHQQTDIRHKIKTLDWSRLLNKPLKIHKTQTEPYKWKVEFEVNIPRLKQVNIYKNPTIVNNEVVRNYDVITGYYHNGAFYENYEKEIRNLENDNIVEETGTYYESDIQVSDNFSNIIECEDGKYYFGLNNKIYYKYENGELIEYSEKDVPQTSLIHSQSFIDNSSHFFRHILYEDNTGSVKVNKYVFDDDGSQKYQLVTDSSVDEIGKYVLNITDKIDVPRLHYNITDEKYYVLKDDEFIEIDSEKIIFIDSKLRCSKTSSVDENNNIIYNYRYYYMNESNRRIYIDPFNNNEELYYIFTQTTGTGLLSPIPLIETEDITPIISNDKYVIEVYTYNDYHFFKGYPEIDFIDYNNNNIIGEDERNYDNLSIEIEKINNKEYLTFRVHQFGIKLVEVFKDEKPIHIADFIIEKLGYSNKQINNNFAHIYNYNDNEVYYPFQKDTDTIEEVNLDVDKYVWRLEITDNDKSYDEKGNFELKNKYDLKVTYYDSAHPYDSNYDKILTKTYVCEDSVFYHDISLDVIGAFYNVPRHIFSQPTFENYDDEIEFYSKTYPTFCNSLTEDDYNYQKRLEYYINNYNKIYFPVLELWKYFNIDSELINRKVIVAEQNYSYMRNLEAYETKYINELGKNKLDSFYNTSEVGFEEETNFQKPKLKSIISPEEYVNSRNGILIDEDLNYIKDIYGTLVRTDYVYSINENGEYVIEYENASRKFQWYVAENDDVNYQIKLTDLLKVVPNTQYQLRFCVKEYPSSDLNLKLIYKNNNGDIREIEEFTPIRQDYEELGEYNELIYTNYNKEWGVSCEYICTNFLTLENAQNVEICLESESTFSISDVTLQRITVNHLDSEYMKTRTDYNSCVYDLYADYTKIPSNIRYEDLNIFSAILNNSLPLTKKGYFNFIMKNTGIGETMNLEAIPNIHIKNMLDYINSTTTVNDYSTISSKNSSTGLYEKTYTFKKYVKKGNYTIYIKPYSSNNENNIISDFKIDVQMLIYNSTNNSAHYEKLENCEKYLETNDNGTYFKIPFENKSNNTFRIRIYHTNKFSFKNFKIIREFPLSIEEMT